MKKGLLISLSLLAISNIAFAYHFSGLYHIGDDGTYSVELYTSQSHYYIGNAEENADGTLDVSVQDINGELYKGTAIKNGYGSYRLILQNYATEKELKGTMNEN